jgi:hypothetical protein
LNRELQDYVVAGRQPWIDGISTGEGTVRQVRAEMPFNDRIYQYVPFQFVVTEMHKGFTVEEQVTGEARVGGLQFDVYPRRRCPAGLFYRAVSLTGRNGFIADEARPSLPVSATPAELHIQQQEVVAYVRWAASRYRSWGESIPNPSPAH